MNAWLSGNELAKSCDLHIRDVKMKQIQKLNWVDNVVTVEVTSDRELWKDIGTENIPLRKWAKVLKYPL